VSTPRIAAGRGSVAAPSICRAPADGEADGLGAADSDGCSLAVAVVGLAADGEQDCEAETAGDASVVRAGCGDVTTDGVAKIDGVMESLGVADVVSVGSQVGPALGPAAAAPAVVSIAKPRAGSAARTAADTTGLRWRTVMAGRRLQVARSTRPLLLIEWLSRRRLDRTPALTLTTDPAPCAHQATLSAAAALADR